LYSDVPHTVLLLADPSGGAPGEKQTLERHGYTVFTAEVSHRFTVKLTRDDETQEWVLTVSNLGRSFPAEIDLQTTESLGLLLVSALAGQLDGELSLRREPTPQFTIRLPAEEFRTD
jgi:two-component sensor histidine kinase